LKANFIFTPHISLLHVTCAISSQSSLLNPLDHPHWSLFSSDLPYDSSLKITNRCFRHAAPHLWNKLPAVLCEFVFLISLIHHHHPALLHRHALILDRLLTFRMAFLTLVLNCPFLVVFPFIAIYPFSGWIRC